MKPLPIHLKKREMIMSVILNLSDTEILPDPIFPTNLKLISHGILYNTRLNVVGIDVFN